MADRVRRDRLGRRIGYNWWREYNVDLLLNARLTWEQRAEAVTLGYATEMEEYRRDNPAPNLKSFLLANKGIHREPSG